MANGYKIDPIAFFLALVCAPLVVALVGFWALFIPVFAVLFGGIPYFLLGTPTLIWGLHRFGPRTPILSLLAVLTVTLLLGILAKLDSNGFDVHPRMQMLPDLALFSVFFAALWAAVFSVLYSWIESKTYADLNADFHPNTLRRTP